MADSGVAVVAPMPSEQQHEQQSMDQDKMVPAIAGSKINLAHRIITPVTPPSLPLPPQSQPPHLPSTGPRDERTANGRCEEPQLNQTDEPCKMEVSDVPTVPSALEIKKEHISDDETTLPGDETITSGCSSGRDTELQANKQLEDDPSATTAEQTVKKKRKIDETIIDGFAISAFKSWEELQDDMNERIASNLLKKRAAEMEAANNTDTSKDQLAKKKKSKSKSSHTSKNSMSSTSGNPSSLLEQPKVDKVKKSKKEPSKTKSSDGQTSKTTSSKSASSKKKKTIDRSKENADQGTSLGSQEAPLEEKGPSNSHKRFKEDPQRASDNSNDIQSRSVDKHSGQHASQSPQVHNIRNPRDQPPDFEMPQSRAPPQTPQQQLPQPPRVLAHDLLRDPHATANPQPAQYSPYGNNPHLNHLYNVTSNIQNSMQTPPFNHHIHTNQHHHQHHQHPSSKLSSDHHSKVSQHSQSQQHTAPKQNIAPTAASAGGASTPLQQQSQSPHPSQKQPSSYQHGPTAPMMPPNHHGPIPSMGNINQSHPFYHNPMHMPGPNSYMYQHQHAGMSQHHPPIPPHINPTQMQSAPHNPYAQPLGPQSHHLPHHQPYPGYLPHGIHHSPAPSIPPFGMYPPQMQSHQQPQTSSMMASMSMSQLPNPYGSPYIVNETTISRQTSIIPPPMPSALEQAAASAAASRFGHHPMLPSIGAFNPAAAAAAAAAAVANHHHSSSSGGGGNPAALYQSPTSSAERNFMDLARSYNAAAAAAASSTGVPSSSGQLATYPSLTNSQTPGGGYPPTTPTSAASSLYGLDRWPTKMSFEHHQRAVSRFNSLYQNPAGYPMRPQTFPAGLFPPPF